MYILLRDEITTLRKGLEDKGYPIQVLPKGAYFGHPAAIVLSDPSLDEIREEAEAIMYYSMGTRLIVITHSRHCYLIGKLFPGIAVIPDDSSDICTLIEKAIRHGRAHDDAPPKLTETELKLLHELGYGMSNKELSERMGRSERTIRRIKESIFLKTGLISSEQLLLYTLYRLNTRSS